MALKERKFLKDFGSEGLDDFFQRFGGFTNQPQKTEKTKNIDELQELSAFMQGWQKACEQGNKLPVLEEMNGLFYVFGYFLKYLYQMGIPEWNKDEEYKAGSVVKYNRIVYTANIANTNIIPEGNSSADMAWSGDFNFGGRVYPTSVRMQDQTGQTDLYPQGVEQKTLILLKKLLSL